MKSRVFLTAAVAGLVCAQALAATPPAAPAPKPAPKPAVTAAAGPWAKVPAPPTACYSSQDHYFEQNTAAADAVSNEQDKLKEQNTALDNKANEVLQSNPMAMMQALQQKMMDDPQNAQKYMEQMVKQGQDAQTAIPAAWDREKQIEAEKDTVIKQYKAALAKAYGPGNARWDALKKKRGYAPDTYGPGETGEPDWVYDEWVVILREWDQAYQATCATWFGPAGPLQAYLKRYKDFLVKERIPYEKKNFDEPKLEQYGFLGVSTASYRSTNDHEAVKDYLAMAYGIFGERQDHPRCPTPDRCE
ncbi:MAG: hypothetical protein WBO00_06060 [Steroidobacteraceae bacterium]